MMIRMIFNRWEEAVAMNTAAVAKPARLHWRQ